MKNIILSSFAGLSPAVIPTLLKENAAVEATNTRLWDGSIKAYRVLGDAEPLCELCRVSAVAPCGDESDVYAKDGKLYWGKTNLPLGIPAPTQKIKVTVAETNTEKTNVKRNPAVFRFTVFNDMGEESAPSPPSNIIQTRIGDKVVFSGFPVGVRWRLWAYTSKSVMEGATTNEAGTGLWLVVGEYEGPSRVITINKAKWFKGNDGYDPDSYCAPPAADCIVYSDLGYYIAWKNDGMTIHISERNNPARWNRRSIYRTQSPIKGVAVSKQSVMVATASRAEAFNIVPDASLTGIAVANTIATEMYPALFTGRMGLMVGSGTYQSRYGLVAFGGDGQTTLLTGSIINEHEFEALWAKESGVGQRGSYYAADPLEGWIYDHPERVNGVHELAVLVRTDQGAENLCAKPNGGVGFERAGQSYEWDSGKTYLKARWKSKVFRSKSLARWAVYRILGENLAGVRFIVWMDGVKKFDTVIDGSALCYMPTSVCGFDTQLEVILPASALQISINQIAVGTSKMAFTV